MNTKTLVAAVLGGLASFFGGWLLYGILLKSTMESMMGAATGVMKTDARNDDSRKHDNDVFGQPGHGLFVGLYFW